MTVPIDAHWRALLETRHAWAFDAYDDFMAALSAAVRERMGHKSGDAQAYVVVFGQTQVGKTTLILDMMGVVPDAIARVSSVLRGGRESGRSATATTMEYCRSPDERWGLRQHDRMRWMTTDDEMTHALGELRASMEAGQLAVTRPCLVFIPKSCFGDDPAQLVVRMLDLPGDQPANPVEQAHVKAMA